MNRLLTLIALVGLTLNAQSTAPTQVSGSTLGSALPDILNTNFGNVYKMSRQSTTLPTTCDQYGEEYTKISGTHSPVKYWNSSSTSTCAWIPVAVGGLVHGVYYPGSTPTTIVQAGLASGYTDLVTVASGRRLFVSSIRFTDPGSNSATCHAAVKVGGVYYMIGTSVSPTAGSSASSTAGIALEAGDVFALYCSAAGITATAQPVSYESTGALRTYRVLGLATGNNTLLTAAAGTIDSIVGTTVATLVGPGQINYTSDSGGSRTFSFYVTPSGGSATLVGGSATLTASNHSQTTFEITLTPGDKVIINSSAGAATQIAWINVLEF